MIDLTPLEVRKKKGDFRRAMRGYDAVLVDDFLDLVADRLEELVRENMALHERVGRQEEQVKDYRDRERALTEALVSAQEMREEVRKQVTREAELAKRSAEQQADQLRATAEAEVRQLRSTAQQRASQELADLKQERQREEQVVRELRARREEFLGNYRALLEQELEELGVIARAAGVPSRSAPQKRQAQQASPSAAGAPAPSAPGAPAPAAVSAAGPEEHELLDEEDVAEESALVLGADPADILDESEDDEEPFAPEPFVQDETIDDTVLGDAEVADEAGLVAEAYEAESAMSAEASGDDVSDRTDVSDHGVEGRLYDGVAADEDNDGVPGPIGLGPEPWDAGSSWSLPDLQLVEDENTGDALDLDYDEDEDDDEEMQRLLRNAAAAGYHLDDDPVTDELLLDEAVPEEEVPEDEAEPDAPADDGWLPTLLEDDK